MSPSSDNLSPFLKDLKDFLVNGLVKDLFHAEYNLHIYEKIASRKLAIENLSSEEINLLAYIQNSANIKLMLALSRLYDKPNNRFPTRCILSFLKMINKHKDEFSKVEQYIITKETLERYDCLPELINAVTSDDPSLFPFMYYSYYYSKYQTTSIQQNLDTLKVLRDKFIAHNESYDIDTIAVLKEQGFFYLINFAKEIISVAGIAFFSIGFSGSSKYLLSEDAYLKTCFVDNLLEKLLD
ncbi:hypothetical protein OKW21_005823 [Catalinimonas alkaloidigena]|uniref:hypothetical protein n=1 Tax=Catalinimonas alkaloidigena TaxID=1075417 RepID=UPI002405E6F1|nr:hypothetical protein [Catalinimonas alkaloidigena]MDF9800560.1 hypothetical protein [Catalinimonas alkaloidigena]